MRKSWKWWKIKKEELSKESDNYLIELEELEKKAENLEKILKEKIRENYTSDNTNNGISQPQSIIAPIPNSLSDSLGSSLNFLYSRKIQKGEEAYQKKYEEMEALYKEKIYILNEKFERKKQTLDNNFKELADIIQETLNEIAIIKEKIVKLEEGIWHE